MAAYVVVCAVALIASALTFFSGFGLGTLLLPAFTLFFPVDAAVASTAVVHFLNGLFKLALVGRHTDVRVLWRFGVPAIAAAFAGAWLLLRLSNLQPLATYPLLGGTAEVTLIKLVVGALLLAFALLELSPRFASIAFPPAYIPLGGILSGFLGGLSGMQGALRSAFLVRSGLSKESFVATGVSIAVVIDIARLGVYSRIFVQQRERLDLALLVVATVAAFTGAASGNALLKKITMKGVQRVVATMLALVAVALMLGLL